MDGIVVTHGTNTYRLKTFQSSQLGFLGYVDIDGEKHSSTISSKIDIASLPAVEIIYSY